MTEKSQKVLKWPCDIAQGCKFSEESSENICHVQDNEENFSPFMENEKRDV